MFSRHLEMSLSCRTKKNVTAISFSLISRLIYIQAYLINECLFQPVARRVSSRKIFIHKMKNRTEEANERAKFMNYS